MTNQDKQHHIYIRSTKQRVPCTKEQFDDYYRDINAYRRTQMNHGRCVCPPSKWLTCDIDCYTCPYRTIGDISSLDDNRIDVEGKEMSWLDHLQDIMPDLQVPAVDEIVTDSLDMRCILTRLCEIMPQAIEIGKLRQAGYSDLAIAQRIGVRNTTFISRLQSAKRKLEKEFPDFF